jgi:site-specific DNA recombinase
MKDSKIKKAVGYVRVSSAKQREGESLDTQKDRIKAYCDIHDLTLSHIFEDAGYTGSNIDRPDFKKMMNAARENEFDVIVAYDMSRFSRSTKDFLKAFENLQEIGIDLAFINDKIDTQGPTGKLLVTILSAIAEWDRENILQRTQENRHRLWQRNEIFLGQPPFGYDWDKEKRELVRNEKQIEIYEELVSLYLDSGYSFLDIANLFKKKGYACKSGKWSTATLSYIIKNTAYYGKYVVNQKSRKDGTPKPADEHISYNCPIVISKTKWDRLQDKTAFNRVKSKKSTYSSEPYFLRDMLRCASCGGKISHHHGAKRKDGSYKRYYSCYWSTAAPKTLLNHGKKKCLLPQIDAELIEELIWNDIQIFFVFSKRDKLKEIFGSKENLKNAVDVKNELLTSKRREKAKIDKSISKLLDLYEISPEDNKAIVNDRLSERRVEQAELVEVITNIEQEISNDLATISNMNEIASFAEERKNELRNLANALCSCSDLIKKRIVESFIQEPLQIELLTPPENIPDEYKLDLYKGDYLILGESKDKKRYAALKIGSIKQIPNIKIIKTLIDEGLIGYKLDKLNSPHSNLLNLIKLHVELCNSFK